MAADASVFADHERDFLSLSKSLQERVAAVSAGEYAGDPTSTVRALDAAIMDASSKVRDMEVEVRGMSAATRRQLGAKVKDYRKLLDGIKADFRRAKDKTARDSLLRGSKGAATYGSGADLSDESRGYHASMEASTAKASSGTAMLEGAVARLGEVDAAADGTIDELSRQGDTLRRTRGRLDEVNGSVGLAQSILRSMQGRETRFKICIILFALVVLVLIGVVVWLTFFNK